MIIKVTGSSIVGFLIYNRSKNASDAFEITDDITKATDFAGLDFRQLRSFLEFIQRNSYDANNISIEVYPIKKVIKEYEEKVSELKGELKSYEDKLFFLGAKTDAR